MGNALRAVQVYSNEIAYVGLNPCFNGKCSQRPYRVDRSFKNGSFNPCFNGKCSQSFEDKETFMQLLLS